ncbi:MAG: hypothetical protein LQ346_008917 [Caloplaca aetnensis]|nr:MAG: hypothetical protein LQ346_008917 [Caloplaca aetnensis]
MNLLDDQVHADAFGDFPVGSIVRKVQHGMDTSSNQKDSDVWGDTPVGRRIDPTANNRVNTQSNGTVSTYAHKQPHEKAEDYVYLHSTGKTAPNGKPTMEDDVEEDDDDDGLPDGWEKARTQRGSRYYVNHNDFTTQWSRPDIYTDYDMFEDFTESDPLPEGWESRFGHKNRTTTWQNPSPRVNKGIAPLPPGWERRRDHKQRAYYVDHNTRTTSWCHPLIAYNDDETRPLPEGWERRRAKDEKRFYYVDRDYNKTSYFFPDHIVHGSKQFIPSTAPAKPVHDKESILVKERRAVI